MLRRARAVYIGIKRRRIDFLLQTCVGNPWYRRDPLA